MTSTQTLQLAVIIVIIAISSDRTYATQIDTKSDTPSRANKEVPQLSQEASSDARDTVDQAASPSTCSTNTLGVAFVNAAKACGGIPPQHCDNDEKCCANGALRWCCPSDKDCADDILDCREADR